MWKNGWNFDSQKGGSALFISIVNYNAKKNNNDDDNADLEINHFLAHSLINKLLQHIVSHY